MKGKVMKPVILFRKSLADEDEFEIAKKYFTVKEYRSEISNDEHVICRYSALPYYEELFKDVHNMGGCLVNSYHDHLYIQDIGNWYHDYKDLTPKTWFNLSNVVNGNGAGSFVLKGKINSRKQLWKTHMFAKTRADVMPVYNRLMDDTMLQHQGIAIREFVDLVKYDVINLSGCPVSKEFRFIIYNNDIVGSGFYWSGLMDKAPSADEVPREFLQEIINRMNGPKFWIVDIGQLTDGTWTIIEFGDAQMAGLSCIDPEQLYSNLAVAV